jgi:serine/threonine-protein kinase RsbW
MQTLITEKISSRLDAMPGFMSRVLPVLEEIIPLEDERINVRLALEEAITNAIRHGNKMDAQLSVTIDIQKDAGDLIITVTDQGAGFDFNSLADPTHSENLMKTSGRGIFLIRQFMDRVEFSDCGRSITMVKSLRGTPP